MGREMATVACQRCGRVDTSLRMTVFPWVVSIVIMSYKRAAVGIFCSPCRSSEKWKYFGISALLGWWGIPWGLFWTLEALAKNASGGQQPIDQNAALLAVLGQEFLDGGNTIGAREAWSASLAIKSDPTVERALLMLDVHPSAPAFSGPSIRPGDVVRLIRGSHVRSSPDEASPIVVSSAAGATHVALARRSGWTQVRLGAGVTGWLADGDIVQANS